MRKLLSFTIVLFLFAPFAEARHRSYYYGYAGWGPWLGPVWVPGPPPNRGLIDTDIQPEDAAVYVDGKRIGEADDFDGFPEMLQLRPGNRKIEFRHKGYRPLVVEVDLQRGWLLRLDDQMERGDSDDPVYHRSSPPSRGDDEDDDAYESDEDGEYQDDDRRPRRHMRDERRDDEDDTEPSSYERSDASDRAPAPRDRQAYRSPRDERDRDETGSGIVRFDVQPRDASVYVDGEYQGSVREIAEQGGLALSAGDHEVVVTMDGFDTRRIDVSVTSSTTSEVSMELEPDRAS